MLQTKNKQKAHKKLCKIFASPKKPSYLCIIKIKIISALDITVKSERMKQAEVKTLEQLSDYINEREDWPLEVDNIIESNGWKYLPENDWVVCLDSEGNRAELNEDGKVEVIYSDEK